MSLRIIRRRRGALLLAAGVALSTLPARGAAAQSLRGSGASVERMYREARSERLHFYATPGGVRDAARRGVLVRLVPDGNFTLHRVGYPYVRPAVRTFVVRLAAQYRAACGERLVVTSATRPATRQPANASARSVHPAGIAVDLRKPDGRCLRWLRTTLPTLERGGLIEVTEEFGPPHFHVAVYPTPYARYVAARTGHASASLASRGLYRVRAGDTLWDIAREHDTTVDRIVAANDLDAETIAPAQTLAIPDGSADDAP